VASAKRGVRGGFSDALDDDESEEVERAGVRLRAAGLFFSSIYQIAVSEAKL